MEFCPKCGSRLEPKKSKTGKEASLMLVCPKCGYKKQEPSKKVEPKVGKVIQHSPQQFVAVIGKEEQKLRTLPTVRIECPIYLSSLRSVEDARYVPEDLIRDDRVVNFAYYRYK